jgi:hypothetical protein
MRPLRRRQKQWLMSGSEALKAKSYERQDAKAAKAGGTRGKAPDMGDHPRHDQGVFFGQTKHNRALHFLAFPTLAALASWRSLFPKYSPHSPLCASAPLRSFPLPQPNSAFSAGLANRHSPNKIARTIRADSSAGRAMD